MIKLLYSFVFVLIIGCAPTPIRIKNISENYMSLQKNNFPQILGFVSDFEKTMTTNEVEILNKMLEDYKIKIGNEIAIASIETDQKSESFYQYALDLSSFWEVGKKNQNNGLTIVYSKKLKSIRISTGIGTEKILTDKICEDILNKYILPDFKKGNYFLGLQKGIEQIIMKWK